MVATRGSAHTSSDTTTSGGKARPIESSETMRAISVRAAVGFGFGLGLCLWLAMSASAAHAQTPAQPGKAPDNWTPVQITWDYKIAMRDGVKLSATIYRDPKQTKPLPVIVTLTPYIAEHTAKQGIYFAQNGYVFVAMYSRGRGNSE
jgi:predicted acyl esterase